MNFDVFVVILMEVYQMYLLWFYFLIVVVTAIIGLNFNRNRIKVIA